MQDKKKGSKNSQMMSERPEEESGEKSKTPLQGKAQNEASPDDKSSELRRQEESQSTEKITDKD